MRSNIKYICFLFVPFIFFSCQSANEIDIREIIQTVKLTAGVTDTVIVSDMFYSEDYDLHFISGEDVSVEYNKEEGKVIFFPNMDFEGMALVDFKYGGNDYQFPVTVRKKSYHTFKLTSDEDYESLSLFGSFNSWNREQYKMADEDNNGTYEVKVSLEPGTYQYKYYGDGNEFIDPANEIKVPNGLGDYNSVLVIPARFNKAAFLHKLNYNDEGKRIVYNYLYERGEYKEKLIYENLIYLLDNKRLSKDNLVIEDDLIKLTIDKSKLTGTNILRFAVTQNGQNTNMQTVIMTDGVPVKSDDEGWYDGIIYSLMTDRFNDGDGSINKPVVQDSLFDKANYMGGDFQGIIDKLNEGYFDSLGVNVLWISPVYDNPSNAYKEFPAPHRWYSGYHGYWPVSPERVEENFGDMKKLKELIGIAHDRNIRVLLDFVSNHVHEQHPYFKEHRDWFGKLELPDGRLNLRFWDEYRLTTWFEPYLPSFDYISSPEALETMTDNAVWWLKETGADGFRHDAVKHVPNIFWRRLTEKIKREIEIPQHKYVYQIGETFGSYDLVSSYVNHGQLSAQFNFEIYNTAQAAFIEDDVSFQNLEAEMQKTFSVYGGLHLMGNIMDSHDKNRFIAYADGDLDLSQWSAIEIGWNNPPKVDYPSSYRKAELYMAFMMTIPGLPVIYYGSEFGMTGASDPDNRRMMRFDNELSRNEKNMLHAVSKITNLRANHSALRYGDYYPVVADENIYCYIRSDFNERILVVLNKNEETQKLELTIPEYYEVNNAYDLMTGDHYKIENYKLSVMVEGSGWKIVELN